MKIIETSKKKEIALGISTQYKVTFVGDRFWNEYSYDANSGKVVELPKMMSGQFSYQASAIPAYAIYMVIPNSFKVAVSAVSMDRITKKNISATEINFMPKGRVELYDKDGRKKTLYLTTGESVIMVPAS